LAINTKKQNKNSKQREDIKEKGITPQNELVPMDDARQCIKNVLKMAALMCNQESRQALP
jgi:hypothetical protein